MFKFYVDSIELDGMVVGRNVGGDIPVGTTFTGLRRLRAHQSPGEFRTEDLGEVGSVALTLREVHWFQRTINVVPGGHSAGLRVAGEGLDSLANLLRELPPHDFVLLTAPETAQASTSDSAEDMRRTIPDAQGS